MMWLLEVCFGEIPYDIVKVDENGCGGMDS